MQWIYGKNCPKCRHMALVSSFQPIYMKSTSLRTLMTADLRPEVELPLLLHMHNDKMVKMTRKCQ